MSLNILDYVLLAILVFFVFSGFRRGFLWQLISIAGVVGAFILAGRYHAPLAETGIFAGIREKSAQGALITSFLGIFIAISLVTGFIASWIGRKLEERGFGSYDKLFGAILGGAKAVLLLGGAAVGLQQYGLPEGATVPIDLQKKTDSWIAGSYLVPRLSQGCFAIIELIPRAERDEIAEFYAKHKEIFSGKDDESEKGPDGTAKKPPEGLVNSLTDGTKPAAGTSPSPASTAADGATRKLDPITRIAGESNSGRLPDLGSLRRFQTEFRDASLVPSSAKEDEAKLAPSTSPGTKPDTSSSTNKE
jgi:uncharacterized membrane protein required for colicin V production